MKKQFLMIMSFLMLSACSVFSPVKLKQENQYVLDQLPNLPRQSAHRATLLVVPPDARPVYNTRQMVYTDKQYQIKYYVKNQWAETPAQMLQSLLMQGLQKTHYFRAVVTLPYSSDYDYALNTTILEFQQDFTTAKPVVRIAIDVKLVRAMRSQVVASKLFSITYPMNEATPYAGVVASNQALATLLDRIIFFCFENLPR